MKQSVQRTSLLAGLLIFAILWTGLMGLGVRTVSPTERQAAPAGTPGPVAGTGAQITYVDNSQFPTLTVYMAVNDAAGQPVFNLGQEDFILKEDGRPVPVQNFVMAGGQAATVLLVIDRSGSMDSEGKMTSAQQAANTFIDRLQPGHDRVGIIAFDNRIETLAPLSVVSDDAAKGRLKQAVNQIRANGGTEFYQAVQAAVRQLERESGRKVVLALTDGIDNSGQQRLNQTIQAAQDARVPVYAIGLGRRDVDEQGMRQLAQQSDGKYYLSPNAAELEALYQNIASGLRNEYAITYQTLTRDLDGTLRNLSIEIATADGALTTEGGYQVGGILASSLNLVLFVPLFALLLLGLVGLYLLPGWRRREAAVASEVSVYPLPSATEPLAPRDVQASSLPPATAIPISTPPTPAAAAPTAANGAALILPQPLGVGVNLVGSGPDCNVQIFHPSVSAHHIRILPEGHRYVLEDLSAGRTWVSYTGDPSQLRPVERNALKEGSLVQIGEVQLTFRQAEMQAQLERRYTLPAAGLTLGSAPDCEVVVPGVAPHQAQVAPDADRWVVIDLAGSGTGVSYSGDPAQERPVSGRNAIKTGSYIKIGSSRFCFQAG